MLSFDHNKVKELENKLKEAQNEEEKVVIQAEINEVMSKEDTPLYSLRHYTNKEIADRVMKTADILGLIPYLKRKPAALSGGQRQRVALGRAIVRNPKVFLMDEPLSNLDAKLRVQTRSEIIKIHERVGATTIYVTHDQTEAMTMASRIVIMKDGYIQQIGTPEEVYSHPSNMFVGGFIGSPSMNFINGTFNGKDFVIDGEQGLIFHLNKEQGERLGQYVDKKVVLGIRPENIYIEGDNNNEAPSKPLELRCDICELLGYEKIVYCNLDKQRLTIKIPAKHNVRPNDVNKYCFDTDKVLFFDAETTKVIE